MSARKCSLKNNKIVFDSKVILEWVKIVDWEIFSAQLIQSGEFFCDVKVQVTNIGRILQKCLLIFPSHIFFPPNISLAVSTKQMFTKWPKRSLNLACSLVIPLGFWLSTVLSGSTPNWPQSMLGEWFFFGGKLMWMFGGKRSKRAINDLSEPQLLTNPFGIWYHNSL